ncbi:M3 family metallopeptidase [uncultured Duncaniella sp.]|uniref:M3 family metallopeptidase n=1 Tax=uncultured Duncaniella sp. TaxID=2768039 RepID=UPI00339D9DE9
MPALRAGIAQKQQQIRDITSNPETPTFDNTIMPLERSGEIIDRVAAVFFALDESNNSPEMVAIAEEFYPMYSQFSDEITMDDALFQRIRSLYERRDQLGLSPDRRKAVEDYYKVFARNGALLDAAAKDSLKALNTELTELYLTFNRNLLNATNAFSVVVDDKSALAGLPEGSIAVAAEEAASRGLGEGHWVFTLHAPSRLPLLQYADNRDLRKKIYQGYTTLASSGEYNNLPVISRILQVRAKKAALLGFENYGAYMTSNVMAKTVGAAEDLLMQIWRPAVARVQSEVAEMQQLADSENAGITIEPWDYYYYAEKVRRKKFNLDENDVRAYFAVDSVRKGIFGMAERLYGIKFTEMPDAPKYYPEVTVYDVTDAATGEHVAVFMTDYFTRASKRQGAWMSEFKGSWQNADGSSSRPIIYNVGNFTRPTADTPALLTLDEVETMFHEFGHGLHGMLSRAPLKSQAGTNVDRDFVELPSQIHEHWAFEPELLRTYAHHYKTGEVIPDELIAKLEASATHNQGFTTAELAGAALLDLQFGKLNPEGDVDVAAFQDSVTTALGMPSQLTFRYRAPYFKHIFGSDGYASGYYTYLWAEVLDTDGFELFKQKGIFDPETARKFKEYVLEKGGSEDPMELYIRFRGQAPTVDALLRNRGLTPENQQMNIQSQSDR